MTNGVWDFPLDWLGNIQHHHIAAYKDASTMTLLAERLLHRRPASHHLSSTCACAQQLHWGYLKDCMLELLTVLFPLQKGA